MKLFIAWIVLFCAAMPGAAAQPAQKHPNILWLVSEDNDPFLGCYGDRFAHTPILDNMAREGVLYLNAFANAPVCAPSRSTLITGMYASSLGTLHMRSRHEIPADIKFYSTYLRDAGYYCMNPGKTDYNSEGNDKETWDKGGSWKAAPAGKPWMLVLNSMLTHESCLIGSKVHEEFLKEPIALPPYHPDTPEIRSNWVEYYHDVTKMDAWVGSILEKLQQDGLADDTIVFYYSDHGGILPRSKRFVYDSGLHVPMIIRFGKHFQNLAPAEPGTKLDRIVTFIDLAPSLLSLAGAEVPAQFAGQAFLGPKAAPERQIAFGFRGRMDDRYDLSYSTRDKRYRYIRNFMPHLIYGQHLDYMWKLPSMVSWEKAFKEGKCDALQSAFFHEKPSEELYDETADPYEVKNLAGAPELKEVQERLRTALREQLIKNHDAGFLPEGQMLDRAKGGPIYAMTQDPKRYPMEHVLDAAEIASSRDPQQLPRLIELMKDPDAGVRYWAATGCSVRAEKAADAMTPLTALTKDESASVRIAAADAICRIGHPEIGLPILEQELNGKEFDALAALNVLEALGEVARPAAKSVAARMGSFPKPESTDYDMEAAASVLRALGIAGPTAGPPAKNVIQSQ